MNEASAPGEYLGGKLLIVGDVNTGKTTMVRTILEDFCARGLGARIAVLDLAPTIPPAMAAQRGLRGVGGHLVVPSGCDAIWVCERLAPPRLSSTSDAQALAKASNNQRLIDAAWPRLDLGGRDILFVNDISMYLQAGSANELVARLARYGTVVANGYLGERLGGGELTRHERAEMERLRVWFERTGTVLTLTKTY